MFPTSSSWTTQTEATGSSTSWNTEDISAACDSASSIHSRPNVNNPTQYLHRWPKLPICVGNDYSGVRLHIAILSKCMGNLNSSHNVMKNNKIHCLPQTSCVVITPCVYGGFWSRLEAN